MRFRPLGRDGAIVSAIGVELMPDRARPRPEDWSRFIFAALENGINAFELAVADPVVVAGAASAFSAVDRALLFVSWRIGRHDIHSPRVDELAPEELGQTVQEAINRLGLDHLDALVLDEPDEDASESGLVADLKALRQAGAFRYLGLRGHGDAIDAHIASGAFNLLETRFNLTSGWRERNRVRAASARDMAVVGYEPYSKDFHTATAEAAKKRLLFKARHPLDGVGSYGFLDTTPRWTAEEICLAYVLTEPSMTTVQVRASSVDHLERLAQVTEREMPPGLAAQIEMARFMPDEAQHGRRASSA